MIPCALMNGQSLQKAFVPLPGGGQAVYNSSGLLYYGHSDHLGSIKLGSTSSRSASFSMAYAPFGETYASSGSADPNFTGQRQDTVAGLFDFPDREYTNAQGRWPSPDPSGLASVRLSDPQTLNRYAYVRNNPLALIDPNGLADVCPSRAGAECSDVGMNDATGGQCMLDGGDLPCSLLDTLGAEAVQCPNNVCAGIDANGNFVTFVAGAGGATGYFTNQQLAEGIYEWNGQFYSSSQWSDFLGNQVELQKEALADAISLASDSPDGSNWDTIYNSLNYLGTKGGNGNFAWTGDPSAISFIPGWNTGGCEVTCRYGDVPSIHNPGTNDIGQSSLHLDSANPLWGFGFGAFLHGLIDLAVGNLNPGVPLDPW